MGDSSIDLLNSDGCDDFLNSILSSNLYSCKNNTVFGTLIENIFVDGRLLSGCLADVLISDGSDHLMLISKINSCSSKQPTNELKYRNFSEKSLKN